MQAQAAAEAGRASESEEIVIDGSGHILGRLASVVAKELLKDPKKRFVILNAEKVVISGSKENIFAEYRKMREIGSKEKGPYFPKAPDRILKRTIRGMLPYKKARGRDALSRVKVYLGVPEEYKDAERVSVPQASARSRLSLAKFVLLGEVSKHLGWRPRKEL